MTSNLVRYARYAALTAITIVAVAIGGGTLYAYGQSVGRDQVADVLDAGAGDVDAAAAFDPAAPNEAAPTAVQVPSPSSSPGGLFEASKDARKLGGLWLMIVVVVFAAAAELRQRTAPKPGDEEPDPTSWRARTYAISAAVAAVAATLVDIGFGGVGWSALAAPGAFAVGRVWSAINPPKGAKAKPAANA